VSENKHRLSAQHMLSEKRKYSNGVIHLSVYAMSMLTNTTLCDALEIKGIRSYHSTKHMIA